MLNEADNFADIFRGGIPYCLLIALPVLILCTPALASEFQVISMSKFDLNGEQFGSRSAAISLEAMSLNTWKTARHCVLTRLLDITVNDFNRIRQKAGGLIIMLPTDVLMLNDEVKEHITTLEQAMLSQSVSIPVYFAPFDQDLEKIIDDITYTTNDNNKQNDTALGQLLTSVSANGYHVTVSGTANAVNKNSKIPIIQGELVPNQFVVKPIDNAGDGNNLPVVLLTANIKTFGIFNNYPLNADAAVLLVLIEMFSKLHSVTSMTPKYRLGFLLSDSGLLLNFQGSKKWLEIDDNVALQQDLSVTGHLFSLHKESFYEPENVEFVLCLDTITQSLSYNQQNVLYMHVSKPPKEKTSISNFFKLLKTAAGHYAHNLTVEGVHKKINLAETKLAWEHERFSMKRYPAFTLSSVKAPKTPVRTTMFKDDESRILTETLTSAKIIAEALASYMYRMDQLSTIFDGNFNISEENIKSYFGVKSILDNNDIKDAFEKYLKNVKITYDKPDARDPDFMFYNGNDVKLNVYRVKPAVFDLFLTIVIGIYLSTVYLAIQYFPRFYDEISKWTKEVPTGHLNGTSAERLKPKVN